MIHIVLITLLSSEIVAAQPQDGSSTNQFTEQVPVGDQYAYEPICRQEYESLGCIAAGTNRSLILDQTEETCQSSTSSGIRHCPCKEHYSGYKCESCQDGYMMRFISLNGPPSQQLAKPYSTDSPYRSPRHKGRVFNCKACECSPYGSLSPICNKHTGLCSCRQGHEGNKCDQCSMGFYWPSTRSLGESELPGQQVDDYCVACGDCFDGWQAVVSNLRNQSTELMRRAFDVKTELRDRLANLVVGSHQLATTKDHQLASTIEQQQQPPRSTEILEKQEPPLDRLSRDLDLFGDFLLARKRGGDLLGLLADELESVMSHFNGTIDGLTSREWRWFSLRDKSNDSQLFADRLVAILMMRIFSLRKSQHLETTILSRQLQTIDVLHKQMDTLLEELEFGLSSCVGPR